MAGETVLIVEDDSTLLRGLKDNFEAKGYRVKIARDGQEGLDAALAGQVDLILLDIMLPKLNGYEICKTVREHELDVPVIMLTAKGQEDDVIRGLNLGADDYVTKPFSIGELLARAAAFMRRRRASLPDTYRFGDCTLDRTAHKLFRGNAEVTLSPKEFGVLDFFVSRAGRALTRDEIISSVWGGSVVVTARSVDRCITTLRSKIEPDPRHPTFIQTIRDIGYRFEVPSDEDGDHEPELECDSFVPLGRGTRLGRYEIRSLLGRGGMAEVYRARDTRLDRDVAVKVLSQKLAADRAVRMRFEREAKAVAALSHPNILAIYDVARDRNVHFAVMELLRGETLRARLEPSRLDWPDACRIAAAIVSGLAAAHGAGITHRDIKPGNIFLTESGETKILDFGLARLHKSTRQGGSSELSTMTAKTAAGTVMGTTNYMSPEQVRGQDTDARSDIFSLGTVIHEMLAGTPPFLRDTGADTMAAILNDMPPDLAVVRPDVPPAACEVVRRCLEKEPAARYRSTAELAAALDAIPRS